MKSISIALICALATTVFAGVPGLPSCAFSCVNGFGGCSSLNVTCICGNTQFIDGLACCVSKSCDAADQETTLKFADQLCKGAGVTNLPTAATCSATASGASTATAASSATSSGMSTTSGASSATSSGMSSTSGTSMASSKTTAAASSAASSSASSTATAGSGADGRVVEKFGFGIALAGLIAAL